MALPSGPLRLAPSASGSNKPHTFALRYPASHPSDLSTAGAALSSTASGDVSLRIPPGANPAEPRGRRWAGRQAKSNDIECVVVWDESQHSWILHRIDNVVPLHSDDPEPLTKKPPPSAGLPQKPLPLALPRPARPAPPPPRVEIQPNHSAIPPSFSKHAQKDSSRPAPSAPLQSSHPQPSPSSATVKSSSDSVAASSKAHPSQNRLNLSDSSASSSSANGSNGRPAPPSSSLADAHSTSTINGSQISLALPSKQKALAPVSNSQSSATHRTYNGSTLSSTSSSGDHGPLRVVQAEDIEEFDFVDSPPDPEPAPSQPTIAPSPATLPSPAPPHAPSTTWQTNAHRASTSGPAISPTGPPTLSRSSSVADTNAALGGSPIARPTGYHGLALPTRSVAQQPSSAPSPAYRHNGLSRSANLSNQPTAPSPLQSVAYSSSSSPADHVQTAATPVLVSLSPASATATTTETSAAPAAPVAAAGLARPGRLPASIVNAARSGVSSPVPTWQHTQHVQHSFQNLSPHGVNATRSPAPLTNQNLGLATNQPASAMLNRTYHRSDSGSSVRESDTDSEDDDDEDGESSQDDDNFEPVLPPPPLAAPAPVAVQPAPVPEPVQNSEDDAEADEETDEDEELEFQNFATELEASMMIGDIYGPTAMGSYGESMAPVPVQEPPPAAPPAKGKAKKKPAGGNSKANTTTGAKKGAAAGTSKAKGKGKGAKNG